ncbi:MAG TPA: radical SAM protein [Planctomycetaceae bacterium]|nr:radical SAM protein [Planctomycetaceae bacterium]
MISETTIKNVLTRTSGFLRTVTSHSLQPYCGCTFGNALCGVGCYVRHNGHLLKGRRWGSFLEVRTNAAQSYLDNYEAEAAWARRNADSRVFENPIVGKPGPQGGPFSIFCSSSTDPFVPQEFRHGITRSVLEAMLRQPPDRLILQTHSHRVAEYAPLVRELAAQCDVRVHVSIETDRERIPGLPPPASSVEKRLRACAQLREAGLWTVVTVSPLLPIDNPDRFFSWIAQVADAVVVDHFIGGDGSVDGERTLRTPLPAAMRQLAPDSTELAYRDRMAAIAGRHLPGRVGLNVDGFAGRYLF